MSMNDFNYSMNNFSFHPIYFSCKEFGFMLIFHETRFLSFQRNSFLLFFAFFILEKKTLAPPFCVFGFLYPFSSFAKVKAMLQVFVRPILQESPGEMGFCQIVLPFSPNKYEFKKRKSADGLSPTA